MQIAQLHRPLTAVRDFEQPQRYVVTDESLDVEMPRVWVHICAVNAADPVLFRKPAFEEGGDIPPGLYAVSHDRGARKLGPDEMLRVFDRYCEMGRGGRGAAGRREIAKLLAAAPDPQLPPLNQITRIPFVVPDGHGGHRLLTEPGYNWMTGIYYRPDPNLIIDTEQFSSAIAARDYIFGHWLHDLPMAADNIDAATCLAMFIQPYIRNLITSQGCPGYFVTAASQSAAKTLLVQLHGIVLNGCLPATFGSYSPMDESQNMYSIAAWLRTGSNEHKPLFFVDNFDDGATLKGPMLARGMTEGTLTERGAKQGESIPFAFRHQVIFTGNQVRFSADMAERFLTITMHHSAAGETENYHIPDIKTSLMRPAERSRFMSAVLRIILEGMKPGVPKAIHGYSKFGAWSDLMRPIMHVAGFGESFLAGRKERIKLDDEAEARNILWPKLARISEATDFNSALTATEMFLRVEHLIELDAEIAGLPFMDKPPHKRSAALSNYLNSYEGKDCGGVCVRRAYNRQKTFVFWFEPWARATAKQVP